MPKAKETTMLLIIACCLSASAGFFLGLVWYAATSIGDHK